MSKAQHVHLLLSALLLVVPGPVWSQQWSLDAYAGRAKYQASPNELGTSNAVLGLQYNGTGHNWFYLSAAAPLRTGDPFWGAGGMGGRLGSQGAHFTIGIDAGAHGHLFRDQDSAAVGLGGTVFGLPVLAIRSSAVTLQLRSGVRHYNSSFLGVDYGTTLHDSDVQTRLRLTRSIDVDGSARYVRTSGTHYSYAGVSLTFTGGPVSLWGGTGRWFDDALPGTGWNLGGQLAIGSGVTLWTGWQHELSDPLYWNAARTTWNVGISRMLGGRREIQHPVAAVTRQGVTFRVRASESPGPIAVGGDFNKWTPVALERSGNFWTVTLKLPRGTYHYAFRAADGTWFLPASVTSAVDDGFGGRSGFLVVTQ